MKKKIIGLLCIMALTGILCACGENPWEYREVSVPSMEPLVVEEVQVHNETVKIATTQFDFSIEELKEIVSQHAFISDNYDLFDGNETNAYGRTYSDGDYVRYGVENALLGMKKGSDGWANYHTSDFMVKICQNTSDFSNLNYVGVIFNGLDATKENQEQIFPLLTDIYGQEIAEYLTYQKGEIEEGKEVLKTEINVDGATFIIKRKSDEQGQMSFEVSVEDPGFENEFGSYDGGYPSLTENIKYNISQVSGGMFEDLDVKNFRNYGAELMDIGLGEYEKTDLEYMHVTETDCAENAKSYVFSAHFAARHYDVLVSDVPEHDVYFFISEQDGEISKVSFEYEVSIDNMEKYNYEDVVATMKEQLVYLFPNTDLSKIDSETLQKDGSISWEEPFVCMGTECTCVVTVDASGKWTIEADITM